MLQAEGTLAAKFLGQTLAWHDEEECQGFHCLWSMCTHRGISVVRQRGKRY